MRVPIYIEFDGGQMIKLGSVPLKGNSTSQEIKVPLPKKPKRVLINAHFDVPAPAQ